MSTEKRIKFLSRDLPLPYDPSFREYRVVEELTGVKADALLLGGAGVWALPSLAIIALMRANPNVTHEQLEKILDLNPAEFTITGIEATIEDEEEVNPETPPGGATAAPLTGQPSTDEILEPSGTLASPTTSQGQPVDPTI